MARTQVCYTNDAHLPAPSLVALESATPTILTCQNLRLPPFSRIICTIQISWDGPQTSNANVTASLKSLLESLKSLLEMAALFFLKTGTFGAKNWREISVDAILCFLIEIFFEKKGQIHSNFDKHKFFNLTPQSAQSFSF